MVDTIDSYSFLWKYKYESEIFSHQRNCSKWNKIFNVSQTFFFFYFPDRPYSLSNIYIFAHISIKYLPYRMPGK